VLQVQWLHVSVTLATIIKQRVTETCSHWTCST